MVKILKYLAESSVTGYVVGTALILSLGYGLNQLFSDKNSAKAEKPKTAEIERARYLASEIDFYPPLDFSRGKEIATELLARDSLDEVCKGAALSLELQKLSAMSKAGNVLKFNSTTGGYNWSKTAEIPYQTAEANTELEDLTNRALQLQIVCGK